MEHPIPNAEGFFWAKLVHPHRMPVGEYWVSVDWEVVSVWDNNGEGDDKWRASVPGIEPCQPLDAFIWGPRVPDFKPQ